MEATLIWTPNNPPSHHSRPALTAWPEGDAGSLHRGRSTMATPQHSTRIMPSPQGRDHGCAVRQAAGCPHQNKQPERVLGLHVFGLPARELATLFRDCIRTRSCTTSHLMHGVAAGSAPRSAPVCTAQDLPQPPWLHLLQI